ncbi:MAG: hypothetical protein H0T69_11775 [Thermoleophilaceae bacterium]|nr:hypothetical protein [Thermoleophilaceae bacterium]
MAEQSTERCSWCGDPIEPNDGWRLQEVPGARKAAFCRLEHAVPWKIQGARWDAGEIAEPRGLADALDSCARCGARLDDVHLVLVRHRGEHRIPDAFCSVDHMADWAKSGGRWGPA